MADTATIVNRALASFGSRTTVTAALLASNGSNEAIQANFILTPYRKRLFRMAPWSCAFNTALLNYITSVPGTPENSTTQTAVTLNGQTVSIWTKGQPAPPWAYEYQYPVDCVRACWVTPQTATGFASGIPITTAVTGGAPTFWQGPPVKFSVGVDQFYNVTAAQAVVAGINYAVGDLITVALQPNAAQVTNLLGTFAPSSPQGAAAVLQVTGINAGAITSVSVVAITPTEDTPFTGSYFYLNTANATQSTTTGAGSGAQFTLTYSTTPSDQRVILTNQEFAILNYVRDITDPNVWDDAFQEAYILILGAALCKALTGDTKRANLAIAQANAMITEARGDDANEGLKVNDVTPDWLRIRGIDFVEDYSGPYNTGFNWGSLWPGYT